MINPIGPVAFNPYMMPIQVPVVVPMQVPVQPVMLNPNGNQQTAPQMQPSVVYNIPKTSLYEQKNSDSKKVDNALEKQFENKIVEDKGVVSKSKDDKRDATLAEILAAQSGVQAPQVQFKAAESAPKPETKADDKKEVKRPKIVAPDTIKPSIDIDGLVEILNSSDYEEQADAMEAISEVVTYAPEKSGELLDNKVVDNLLNIMEKDTSALQGKDKKLAERNKEYAMFTTATLQKLYADDVKKLGNVTVPTADLIGMAGIVKNLKSNPNAKVREAAVASLGYVNKPEYNNDINSLLNEAANDQNADVRAQANRQLAKA